VQAGVEVKRVSGSGGEVTDPLDGGGRSFDSVPLEAICGGPGVRGAGGFRLRRVMPPKNFKEMLGTLDEDRYQADLSRSS
jgi:hypothetical protein